MAVVRRFSSPWANWMPSSNPACRRSKSDGRAEELLMPLSPFVPCRCLDRFGLEGLGQLLEDFLLQGGQVVLVAFVIDIQQQNPARLRNVQVDDPGSPTL